MIESVSDLSEILPDKDTADSMIFQSRCAGKVEFLRQNFLFTVDKSEKKRFTNTKKKGNCDG